MITRVQRCPRFGTAARVGSKTGAIYIEFGLAVFLLFMFFSFTLVLGRVFGERNRILSANRTVAWLASHQYGGKAEGTFAGDEGSMTVESPAFASLLRD